MLGVFKFDRRLFYMKKRLCSIGSLVFVLGFSLSACKEASRIIQIKVSGSVTSSRGEQPLVSERIPLCVSVEMNVANTQNKILKKTCYNLLTDSDGRFSESLVWQAGQSYFFMSAAPTFEKPKVSLSIGGVSDAQILVLGDKSIDELVTSGPAEVNLSIKLNPMDVKVANLYSLVSVITSVRDRSNVLREYLQFYGIQLSSTHIVSLADLLFSSQEGEKGLHDNLLTSYAEMVSKQNKLSDEDKVKLSKACVDDEWRRYILQLK